MDIIIEFENFKVNASLNNNKTGVAIFKQLPINTKINRWGDEIYFPIETEIELEKDAVEELNVGDLAFWPNKSMFCIFFGATPISVGSKPLAISPVNVFGQLTSPTKEFNQLKDGDSIHIQKKE
jgi:uncharacterized protein